MGEPAPVVSIEALCRAMGVRTEICDPFDIKKATSVLLDLMAMDGGPRVIIMRRECELIRARREESSYRVYIDPDKCVGLDCGCDRLCTRVFACTGLRWNREKGKAEIDELICSSCGLCADICPQGAIIREAL
jgi:indolepyruvate ferredoxin oxidoreductase alpha subunit